MMLEYDKIQDKLKYLEELRYLSKQFYVKYHEHVVRNVMLKLYIPHNENRSQERLNEEYKKDTSILNIKPLFSMAVPQFELTVNCIESRHPYERQNIKLWLTTNKDTLNNLLKYVKKLDVQSYLTYPEYIDRDIAIIKSKLNNGEFYKEFSPEFTVELDNENIRNILSKGGK